MPPPDIRVRGIRSPLPSGYILGRMSPGTGDVELIDVGTLGQQLVGTGVVGAPSSTSALPATGVTPGSYTLASFTVSGDGRLTAASSATLASAKVWVGNGSNEPTAVTVSGDATLANNGALTLANTAVVAGSYTVTALTVDSKGRITAASSGVATSSAGVLPLVTGDVTPGAGPFPVADGSGQYIGVPL